jgi:type I restriction enzyme S subunit
MRVADILSAYDDLMEHNLRRIALLEETARLLYREWFVHFRFPGHEHVKIINSLPQGWTPRILNDVVEVVKQSVKPSAFADNDIHIGLEHIPRRSFTLSDWEPAKDLASGKTQFLEGDILFCKIRPYFHKVGFALRSGLASSDAIVWRVKEEVDWPLVVCATASDHFVAVASKTVREGSKMPRNIQYRSLGTACLRYSTTSSSRSRPSVRPWHSRIAPSAKLAISYCRG